jgi:hypothetical protein
MPLTSEVVIDRCTTLEEVKKASHIFCDGCQCMFSTGCPDLFDHLQHSPHVLVLGVGSSLPTHFLGNHHHWASFISSRAIALCALYFCGLLLMQVVYQTSTSDQECACVSCAVCYRERDCSTQPAADSIAIAGGLPDKICFPHGVDLPL